MHHYQFHVGDYAAHTAHLTPLEDIAYRRILDVYYLNERPLNGSSTDVARAIRMREHLLEVESVLREFFTWKEGVGWVQSRVEREIEAYADRRRVAAKAGRASGKARRQSSNGRSSDVQQNGNGNGTEAEPTGNREPVPSTNPPQPPQRRADARGVDASPDPEPDTGEPADPPAPDPVVALQDALTATAYRSDMAALPRRFELARRADALHQTGLTPADVERLVALDAAKAEKPGGLLAHWLDENIWREVLDGEADKVRHRAAKSRQPVKDSLEGIYGA